MILTLIRSYTVKSKHHNTDTYCVFQTKSSMAYTKCSTTEFSATKCSGHLITLYTFDSPCPWLVCLFAEFGCFRCTCLILLWHFNLFQNKFFKGEFSILYSGVSNFNEKLNKSQNLNMPTKMHINCPIQFLDMTSFIIRLKSEVFPSYRVASDPVGWDQVYVMTF